MAIKTHSISYKNHNKTYLKLFWVGVELFDSKSSSGDGQIQINLMLNSAKKYL